jgi:hypothetical protein
MRERAVGVGDVHLDHDEVWRVAGAELLDVLVDDDGIVVR